MRKPPEDCRFFQKRCSENGPYFVVLDPRGQELAVSRVFSNDAWYTVGCELLRGVPDAEQCGTEETVNQSGKRPRGFTGILIQPADADGYQFTYITVSGRTLLTSVKFSSHLETENAADTFRKIVNGIVQRAEWTAYAPSR